MIHKDTTMEQHEYNIMENKKILFGMHTHIYMCVCTRIMYLSMRYVFIFFSLFLTRKQNFDGILVSINNAIYIVIHIHITEKYIQLLIIIKIEDEKET